MQQIMLSDFVLLKPGDTTMSGDQISVTVGHLEEAVDRLNLATNQLEHFNPSENIFLSPSIKLRITDGSTVSYIFKRHRPIRP